jgi:hypothetical protein
MNYCKEGYAKMDTIAFHFSDKFLPLTLQEIDSNSDVGPYDDDGDTRQHSIPDHEVDRLLNERMSLQTRQTKLS